jgi:hypothetical protein
MTYLGFDLRGWYRRAPLRREWKARAVTFRTELDWVRYQPDGEMKHMKFSCGATCSGSARHSV